MRSPPRAGPAKAALVDPSRPPTVCVSTRRAALGLAFRAVGVFLAIRWVQPAFSAPTRPAEAGESSPVEAPAPPATPSTPVPGGSTLLPPLTPVETDPQPPPATPPSSVQPDDTDVFLTWAATLEPEAHPEAAYRFLDELYPELAARIRAMPGRLRAEQIGSTVRGAPIWAFHCTDPLVHPDDPPLRKLLVFASIHPLEWVGAEAATTLLLDCARRPIPGVALTVVPVLNIDGRRVVEADLMRGEDRYRRTNAAGVDLNRDFSTLRDSEAIWRHIIPNRYATSPYALSQPESRAIDALAARERFDVALSLHTFGGYWYTPWAGHWQRPADRKELLALGHLMESAQTGRPYRTQQLSHWAFFFRGCGMELDHLYARYGTRAFLVELTRSGVSPLAPWTWDQHFRLYNPADPRAEAHSVARAIGALARHLGGQLHPHTPPVSAPRPPPVPTAPMPLGRLRGRAAAADLSEAAPPTPSP